MKIEKKYPELTEFVDELRKGHKNCFKIQIFNGERKEHGMDFMIISIFANSYGSHQHLLDVVERTNLATLYKDTTDKYEMFNYSNRVYRIIIFFEKYVKCAFGLKRYYNTCDNICQETEKCKESDNTFYKVIITGKRAINNHVSCKEEFNKLLSFNNIINVNKFVNTLRKVIFDGDFDLETEYFVQDTKIL